MKIFYDTEFLEDGHTIELISIGMVTEDGREYYAINQNAPWHRIKKHEWLMANVVPSLPKDPVEYPGSLCDYNHKDVKWWPDLADEVREFILSTPDPELWAWYGAYDHVALCQLWGPMVDLPKGIPMWTNDLRQLLLTSGKYVPLPKQENGEHNALEDARHLKFRYEYFLENVDSAPPYDKSRRSNA